MKTTILLAAIIATVTGIVVGNQSDESFESKSVCYWEDAGDRWILSTGIDSTTDCKSLNDVNAYLPIGVEDTTVCYWFNAGTEMEPNWVFVSDYTEDGLCHYGKN